MLKGSIGGVGEKSVSRFILKVEWKGFAGKLDVCERERRWRMNTASMCLV